MNLDFGNPTKIESFVDAVQKYADKEFQSPFRSTVPMLSLLHHAPKHFASIVGEIGLKSIDKVILEYQVPPKLGRGQASHTDAMVIKNGQSLAIEAKWTEPIGQNVENWLSKGSNSGNRHDVLRGWLEMVGLQISTKAAVAKFNKQIYQMIHRAASARHTARQRGGPATMAYFLFRSENPLRSTASTDAVENKLSELWDLIGRPHDLTFCIVEIGIHPTAVYTDALLLKKGLDSTADVVVEKLMGLKPIFKFGQEKITWIG